MLAVALLVSAISFTRTGAGVNTENVASAKVNVHTPDDKYLDIGINKTEWTWAVPFDGTPDSNGNLAVFTYRPNTYKNFYGLIDDKDSVITYQGISGFSSSDTSAKTIRVLFPVLKSNCMLIIVYRIYLLIVGQMLILVFLQKCPTTILITAP